MDKVIDRCRCGNDFRIEGSLLSCCDKEMTVKELFESSYPKIGECGKCGKVFRIERVLFNSGGIC